LIRSTVDIQKNLTVFTCKGKISADEIMKTIKSFYGSTPSRNIIWDSTEADLSSLKGDEIRSLANYVKWIAHSREGGKSAIVSPKNASYGVVRMYQSYAEIYAQISNVEVFRSRLEADRWVSEK
jgi:hypothetical protein